MTHGKNLLNMLLKGEEHAEKRKENTCNKYCTPITINIPLADGGTGARFPCPHGAPIAVTQRKPRVRDTALGSGAS